MEKQCTRVFEAYSYRTSARFGMRVKVAIEKGTVSITGPRIGHGLYRLWIFIQLLLLLSVFLSLILAMILLNWRYLFLSVGLLISHFLVGAIGAGSLWALSEISAASAPVTLPTATFPIKSVKRVMIGRGWARNGLWFVILPYVGGVNVSAEGHAISFEAPDDLTDKDVVYAIHMWTEQEAKELADMLQLNE